MDDELIVKHGRYLARNIQKGNGTFPFWSTLDEKIRSEAYNFNLALNKNRLKEKRDLTSHTDIMSRPSVIKLQQKVKSSHKQTAHYLMLNPTGQFFHNRVRKHALQNRALTIPAAQ